jgi:hypothetical protein
LASADYAFGGSRISLEFASGALLEQISPAFAHLQIAADANRDDEPRLRVALWDGSASPGTPPPRPAAPRDQPRGALVHLHDPPVRVAYQPGLEMLSLLDSEDRRAWYWVRDTDIQATWDQGCPIRQILFWWLGEQGYLQVHGAAVGTPTAGVLVVGPPGSGKSTVALACLGSSLLYAGDDYVAVKVDSSPQVASLYCSAKLDADSMAQRLPQLLPLLANTDRLHAEKAVVYVHEHFPQSTARGFPLKAVVVPRLTSAGAEAKTVAISRAAAFTALAPSTLFQLHTAGGRELSALSDLLEHLPCYALDIGADLASVPAALEELISSQP